MYQEPFAIERHSWAKERGEKHPTAATDERIASLARDDVRNPKHSRVGPTGFESLKQQEQGLARLFPGRHEAGVDLTSWKLNTTA